MKNLSKKDQEKIIELYSKGLKIRLVSKESKIGEKTVCAFLKAKGLTRTPRKSKKELDEIIIKSKNLYSSGLSVKEVARELSVNYTTAANYIKSDGFKLLKGIELSNKKISDYKKQIKELYEQGLSSYEIGKQLGKSYKTILHHLETMGIERRSLKRIDEDVFKEMWHNGATDEEFMQKFNITKSTIRTYRIKNKCHIVRWFSQTEQIFSEIQEQMILGSLLGDLSIRCNVNGKNARLCLVHCEKQKSLFMEKVKILGNFMGSYRLCTPKPDNRTGKVYTGYRGSSKAHPVFEDLYKLIYPNNKKTITKEYLDKINHPIALAYWFMDDGTYNGTIATNSFSENEVDLLVDFLYEKFNIQTHKRLNTKNQFVIFIESKSRKKFDSLVAPYFVESMKYKLKYIPQAWSVNSVECGNNLRALNTNL